MTLSCWKQGLRAVLLLCLSWPALAMNPQTPQVTILCYHEIAENPLKALDPIYTVKPSLLVQHLDWLHNQGYHFISVSQLLAARAGKATLPPKAILLTFDDGYESVYQYVYPALKMYNAPAVLALVGSWLESKDKVDYGGEIIPRSDLLTWDQLHEMLGSGLIEVASHTFASHKGIIGNPQGNTEPAVTTREYFPDQQRYETENEYRARLKADFKKNNQLIHQRLGVWPRVMVWPYGTHNDTAADIAGKLGMPVTMSLDDGPDLPNTPLNSLRRILVESDTTVDELAQEINYRDQGVSDDDRASKIMHVDLDNVYDPDPNQTNKNLGMLLDRIQAMHITTVYLQAFADPDGNGSADAVYFPNRRLPMRADLFNRVAWQISSRTKVRRVYAWMPLTAFELPASDPASADMLVTEQPTNGHLNMGYKRLSLFSPRARQAIREIYQDLSRAAPIQGVLFHDDATMSDYEDNSPEALKTYASWGLPPNIDKIRSDQDLLYRWSVMKTNAIDRFAIELGRLVSKEQPGLKTARNMYAQVVLNPYSETWYSQSLPNSLRDFDFTAIMAMPYMEQAPDPHEFYQKLVDRVKAIPGAMNKVVFELQATDWRTNKPVPAQELADTITWLYSQGVQHIAYYPDDFLNNRPDPDVMARAFADKSSRPQVPPPPPAQQEPVPKLSQPEPEAAPPLVPAAPSTGTPTGAQAALPTPVAAAGQGN